MGDSMSLIKANNITNVTGGIPTVKSQQLIPTAWVNFNGTGTVAIRDSENISSITDVSTGKTRLNFTTTMANTNYVGFINFQRTITWSQQGAEVRHSDKSTTSVDALTREGSNNVDEPEVHVVILGGQA